MLLNQDNSYYQNNFSGSLANKVNDLINYIPDIVQITVDRFISRSLALGIGIYFLWQVNIYFALLMLTWSALFVLSSLFFAKKITHLAGVWSELGSSITGKMVDIFSNIMSVRLFASQYQGNYLCNPLIVKLLKQSKNFSGYIHGFSLSMVSHL